MTARAHAVMPRLEHARAHVRERIEEAAELLAAFEVPRFELGGSVLRPLTAYALAGSAADSAAAPRFWTAALAVQLAHEASLLHDDVIDAAATRRGTPTLAASRGPAAALLIGDHALTSAYRAAAMSADVAFMAMFARAVERTVAGERAQAAAMGERMELAQCREIILAKSGELFGCAAAIGPALLGQRDATRWFELGRRVGLVYQMLDDLLDYCAATDTGKPALGDYAQGRWTWPLSVLDSVEPTEIGRDATEITAALFALRRGASESPARLALGMLDAEIDAVISELHDASADAVLIELLEQWRTTARAAIEAEEAVRRRPTLVSPGRAPIAIAPTPDRVAAYMARHGRSFRFATLILPPQERATIERVYAWCRCTDDIVDEVDSSDPDAIGRAESALDEWLELSRAAYRGAPSGVGLLDDVMGEMASGGVPFDYAELLVRGVRTDLDAPAFQSLAELREYTYRVASVVGLWLCGLYSVSDPWMLERASALGHAMQLTNILRDVGEDLDRGRLYLPHDVLARHGLDRAALIAMRTGAQPVDASYRAMIDEMMALADASYRFAGEAIPHLPSAFGRSVAIAAAVYADIHGRIRANGYDNLRLRAYTTPMQKLAVGARALLRLRAPRIVTRESGAGSALPRHSPHLASLRQPG